MPASTTTPDKQGRELATRTGKRADVITTRFTLAFADFEREVDQAARENDEGKIALAIAAFLVIVLEIINSATMESERWVFEQLAAIYGADTFTNFVSLPENIQQGLIGTVRELNLPDSMAFSFAAQEQQRMVSRIRAIVADGQAAARITAAVTGKTLSQALREQAIGKASAYNFRKLLDNVTVNILQQELWLQGQGTFEKKIVVAIMDKDTTQLCQRLNGTVWNWNELVTDPVTGGQRMFAPFTGEPFVPRFHFCRSAVVPYRS